MTKRFYFTTNGFNGVIFTDGEKAAVIADSEQNNFSTFEAAQAADFSGCGSTGGEWDTVDIIAAQCNVEVIDFNENEFDSLIEF